MQYIQYVFRYISCMVFAYTDVDIVLHYLLLIKAWDNEENNFNIV